MTEDRPPEQAPEPEDAAADPTSDAAPPPDAPPPAYTPPTYTPPPVAPPVAQPAVAWAPPPSAPALAVQRTPLSLAAGILLLILGVLGTLFGLLIAVVGGTFVRDFNFGDVPGFNGANPGDVIGSVVAFVGIVLIVGGLVYLIGGIGIIRSREWGRIIGILVGILIGLFWLAGVFGGGQYSGADGRAGGGLFAAILFAIHAYIAVALLFFWKRGASAG